MEVRSENMIWSKLKKVVQGLLADSLQRRMEYHLTRYGPGVSYFMARGWITLDGQEIYNFSTIKQIRQYHDETGNWWPEKENLEKLHNDSIFSRDDYVDSLEEYVLLDINDALSSSNPLVRAFAMFDRRVGKRRLKTIKLSDDELPIVKNFYHIRCKADGIPL